jgi:alpha/beta superfamily hydrolase
VQTDINAPEHPHGFCVLLHPHPDFGGNRFHPYIDGMFRRLPEIGEASLRFDFSSSDPSVAQEELRSALDLGSTRWPGLPAMLAGYSFGAGVALETADDRIAAWHLLAPPVTALSGAAIGKDPRPKAIVVPEHDQFFPLEAIQDEVSEWVATSVTVAPGVDHFVRQVNPIVDASLQWIEGTLASPQS